LAAAFGRHPAAEASLFRALVLCAHGALRDKAVIVLGDSDLTSLAIGLLGKTFRVLPQAARIVVVETDPSWIKAIDETAQAEGLEIEVL
jgi:predicted methyltransferase